MYRHSRPHVTHTCPSTWELSWNISILRNSSVVNHTITLEAERSEKWTLNVTGGMNGQEEGLTLTLPIMSMETEHTATITAVLANGTSFSDSVVFYTNSCGESHDTYVAVYKYVANQMLCWTDHTHFPLLSVRRCTNLSSESRVYRLMSLPLVVVLGQSCCHQ